MRHDHVDDLQITPRISVCVPMYNNSATIARCLHSILDQDGVEFEIVIVDDNSSDDCATIAATMLRPGDRLIRNESRLGLNGNHNKCMELAHGDCIQFVHGDDWLLPGALQTLIRCFDDPTVGMAFARRRVVKENVSWARRVPNELHVYFPKLRRSNRGSSLVTQITAFGAGQNWIGEPTSVMFRRQLALDVKGFRDDIYQLVDLDFWLRLMLRSTVCFVPEQLSVRNHTSASESLNNAKTRRNRLDHLRIVTWLIVDPASTPAIRTFARVWWLLTWLALPAQIIALGPKPRWLHLKDFLVAPSHEFTRARQLRDGT